MSTPRQASHRSEPSPRSVNRHRTTGAGQTRTSALLPPRIILPPRRHSHGVVAVRKMEPLRSAPPLSNTGFTLVRSGIGQLRHLCSGRAQSHRPIFTRGLNSLPWEQQKVLAIAAGDFPVNGFQTLFGRHPRETGSHRPRRNAHHRQPRADKENRLSSRRVRPLPLVMDHQATPASSSWPRLALHQHPAQFS